MREFRPQDIHISNSTQNYDKYQSVRVSLHITATIVPTYHCWCLKGVVEIADDLGR